ncbi:hypothetical protein CMEL01_08412 [Colletotrichum melonis]|uniref:Uncharacterized protein n=1 Tax=Colletotrichum melonis TaxID=1209925 RepID=A0AAI9TZX3_9PEZI|nr:hypothetical protein CMEL01_08412 [Colletotrichum melonis]
MNAMLILIASYWMVYLLSLVSCIRNSLSHECQSRLDFISTPPILGLVGVTLSAFPFSPVFLVLRFLPPVSATALLRLNWSRRRRLLYLVRSLYLIKPLLLVDLLYCSKPLFSSRFLNLSGLQWLEWLRNPGLSHEEAQYLREALAEVVGHEERREHDEHLLDAFRIRQPHPELQSLCPKILVLFLPTSTAAPNFSQPSLNPPEQKVVCRKNDWSIEAPYQTAERCGHSWVIDEKCQEEAAVDELLA